MEKLIEIMLRNDIRKYNLKSKSSVWLDLLVGVGEGSFPRDESSHPQSQPLSSHYTSISGRQAHTNQTNNSI